MRGRLTCCRCTSTPFSACERALFTRERSSFLKQLRAEGKIASSRATSLALLIYTILGWHRRHRRYPCATRLSRPSHGRYSGPLQRANVSPLCLPRERSVALREFGFIPVGSAPPLGWTQAKGSWLEAVVYQPRLFRAHVHPARAPGPVRAATRIKPLFRRSVRVCPCSMKKRLVLCEHCQVV